MRIGLYDSRHTDHSFRTGAATVAAAAGVKDNVIKDMWKWSSETDIRYIITDPKVIKDAHKSITFDFIYEYKCVGFVN